MELGDSAGVKLPQTFDFDCDEHSSLVKRGHEYVVISKSGNNWILMKEGPGKKKPTDFCRLPTSVTNLTEGQRDLVIRDVVTVYERELISYENYHVDVLKAARAICKPKYVAKSFSAVLEPLEMSHEEIVVVKKVDGNRVIVVGRSFQGFSVLWMKENETLPQEGSFVWVTCYRIEGDISLEKEDNIFYLSQSMIKVEDEEDPEILNEKKRIYYFTKNYAAEGLERSEEETPAIYIPGNLRQISEKELDFIMNRLKNKEGEISRQEAEQYIRDPAIAAYQLEMLDEAEAIGDCTLATNKVQIAKSAEGFVELTVSLNSEEYERCVAERARHQWRIGSEMMVRHNLLKAGNQFLSAFVKLKSIEELEFGEKFNGATVVFVGIKRSQKVLKILLDNVKLFTQSVGYCFQFSPQELGRVTVPVINQKFEDFFERKELFEAYCGRRPAPKYEVQDESEFLVKGRPLDPNQLYFMKMAASTSGWTCAQAPPGCGKTHTTSALVAHLYEKGEAGEEIGGVVVSGTTNAAVTNAADAIKTNFEHIKIIRDFGSKAESEATEKSLGHSLSVMSRHAGEHIDLQKNPEVRRKMNVVHKTEARWEEVQKGDRSNDTRTTKEALGLIQSLNKAESNLKATFLKSFDLQVYATTLELLIRKGSDANIFGQDDDEAEELNLSIQRIILDESAQLNPVEALAIYCTFPNLKHITLLGDIYQLGPHSRLGDKTQVYKFLTQGELNRMMENESVNKCHLRRIYRCHPVITEIFLKPIYGDEIEVGAKAEDRNLAAEKDLTRAQDGSPFAFINIMGQEMAGTNITEATAVFSFVQHLVFEKAVKKEDIVILTYHRAQKDVLFKRFCEPSKNYAVSTSVSIHTVDSFQGKEAKIILLCTTKSSNGQSDPTDKLKFIADEKRVTVAVSRAQHVLYIFGDCPLLTRSKFWKKIIEKAEPSSPFLNDSRKNVTQWMRMRLAQFFAAKIPVYDYAKYKKEAIEKQKKMREKAEAVAKSTSSESASKNGDDQAERVETIKTGAIHLKTKRSSIFKTKPRVPSPATKERLALEAMLEYDAKQKELKAASAKKEMDMQEVAGNLEKESATVVQKAAENLEIYEVKEIQVTPQNAEEITAVLQEQIPILTEDLVEMIENIKIAEESSKIADDEEERTATPPSQDSSVQENSSPNELNLVTVEEPIGQENVAAPEKRKKKIVKKIIRVPRVKKTEEAQDATTSPAMKKVVKKVPKAAPVEKTSDVKKKSQRENCLSSSGRICREEERLQKLSQ